jgi:hypothetical protein
MRDPGEYPSTKAPVLAARVRRLLVDIGFDEIAPPLGAVVHEETIVAGVVDRRGRLVAGSQALARLQPTMVFDSRIAGQVARTGEARSVITESTFAGDSGLSIFAYGLASRCGHWALPPDVRAVAASLPDHVVVISGQMAASRTPLAQACAAYGLTDLQTRAPSGWRQTGWTSPMTRRARRWAGRSSGLAFPAFRHWSASSAPPRWGWRRIRATRRW